MHSVAGEANDLEPTLQKEKKMKKKKTPAQKAALYGVLVALAMILSYIEVLIPLPLGIPGVKPGLANLVVFFALYAMSAREAFLISMVRIILVSITWISVSL